MQRFDKVTKSYRSRKAQRRKQAADTSTFLLSTLASRLSAVPLEYRSSPATESGTAAESGMCGPRRKRPLMPASGGVDDPLADQRKIGQTEIVRGTATRADLTRLQSEWRSAKGTALGTKMLGAGKPVPRPLCECAARTSRPSAGRYAVLCRVASGSVRRQVLVPWPVRRRSSWLRCGFVARAPSGAVGLFPVPFGT